MIEDTARVVVTGAAWMGGGVGSLEVALEEIISSAQREILVVTYSISDGADRLLSMIEGKLRDAVRILFVVERLDRQHGRVPARLERMAIAYPDQFILYDFAPDTLASLHAKCVVADGRTALVGSANLSFNGLVQNYELGVVIGGDPAALLARAVYNLCHDPGMRRILPEVTER